MRGHVHLRRIVRACLGLVALGVVALLAVNVFLNTWLPLLIDRRPQRDHISYSLATMVRPGEIEVRDLEIRHQGPRDQWLLQIDRATVVIDLTLLRGRTFRVVDAGAHGASFRWRPRLDASEPAALTGELWPPIPGLQDPPEPRPEDIYPPPDPWRIVVEELRVDGFRELWLADYRYTGDAELDAAFTVEAHAWSAVEHATLALHGGDLVRGEQAILQGVQGEIDVALQGADPRTLKGLSWFGGFSGSVALEAHSSELSFLEYYLQSAPWLQLSGGAGEVVMDLHAEDGRFLVGSTIEADVADFAVGFLSYSGVGDGAVRLRVHEEDGAPASRVEVDLRDFSITREGASTPHVRGHDLHIVASSPDTAFDRPFTEVSVVLDLPRATIPDLRVYSGYLPAEIGLAIVSGSGTLTAHLEATTVDGSCHGELSLEGEEVHASLDGLALLGDVSVHALVPSGNLKAGRYDVSGSSLLVQHLVVRTEPGNRSGQEDTSGWWAGLSLLAGEVRGGEPTYLDGTMVAELRDTGPLLTIFAEKRSLPGWVHALLDVSPAKGTARIELGTDRVAISAFELNAGKFQVLLDLERRATTQGRLYAGLGMLSLGVEVSGPERTLHLFGARRWYDGGDE